ncbi:MAG: hypothetical protein ACTHJM_14720 [Marmoricola sp.]
MIDEFLDHYSVDPAAGRLTALRASQTLTDPTQLAFAHRTLAVSCRDTGDFAGAMDQLGSALTNARRTGDSQVVADILATRGGTHIVAGNPHVGMHDLSAAARGADGVLLGTILYRRGICRYLLGDIPAAVDDGRSALEIFRRHDEVAWLIRAHTLLGECATRLGRLDKAETHLIACRSLLDESSGYEALRLGMMEAWLAFLRGDVPRALAAFRPTSLPLILDGRLRGEASLHVATVYLAAGLSSEAVEVLTALDAQTIPETLRVEREALLARALLIRGAAEDARRLSMKAG